MGVLKLRRNCWILVCSTVGFCMVLGGEVLHEKLFSDRALEDVGKLVLPLLYSANERLILFCWVLIALFWVTILYLKNRGAEIVMHSDSSGVSVLWWREILLALLTCGILFVSFLHRPMEISLPVVVFFSAILVGRFVAVVYTKASRPSEANGFRANVVDGLILALALCAVVQVDVSGQAFYGDELRWSGPFSSANTFGMLMGVGMVAGLGRILVFIREILFGKYTLQYNTIKTVVFDVVRFALYLIVVSTIVVALLKSYSRGAWVATAFGLAVLGVCELGRYGRPVSATGLQRADRERLRAKYCLWKAMGGPLFSVFLLSLVIMGCFIWKHSDREELRRVASIANPTDFSTMNRIDAWEGGLQMIGDKPWVGFDGNRVGRIYEHLYRDQRKVHFQAIYTNDFFLMGIFFGLPVTVLFLAYISSGMKGVDLNNRKREDCRKLRRHGLWMRNDDAICYSGACVLLIGFWFNGGVFIVATSVVFWVLLELGEKGMEIQKGNPLAVEGVPRGRGA